MSVEQKARELAERLWRLRTAIAQQPTAVGSDKFSLSRNDACAILDAAIARALEPPDGREVVAAGEPSAAAMAQAFIERYESRYTPHTVELVMAEVRARARELDTTPPAKVPEGMVYQCRAVSDRSLGDNGWMGIPSEGMFKNPEHFDYRALAAAQQPKVGA